MESWLLGWVLNYLSPLFIFMMTGGIFLLVYLGRRENWFGWEKTFFVLEKTYLSLGKTYLCRELIEVSYR